MEHQDGNMSSSIISNDTVSLWCKLIKHWVKCVDSSKPSSDHSESKKHKFLRTCDFFIFTNLSKMPLLPGWAKRAMDSYTGVHQRSKLPGVEAYSPNGKNTEPVSIGTFHREKCVLEACNSHMHQTPHIELENRRHAVQLSTKTDFCPVVETEQ